MRRYIGAALAVLLLAGCGDAQNAKEDTRTVHDAADWRAALTASPTVYRTYNTTDLAPVPPMRASHRSDGFHFTTERNPGAYATMVYVGPLTDVAGATALRVRVQVDSGLLYLITTYNDEPPGYERFQERIAPGEAQTALLPLDPNGETIFIAANANGEGPTTATIQSIELIGPPAATP